jgi:hypothetical protein
MVRVGHATDGNIVQCMNVRAGFLRRQTHTQNMQYLLLFYGNNGYAKVPQYYLIRILPLIVIFLHCACVRFTMPCINEFAAGLDFIIFLIFWNKYVIIASLKRARGRTHTHTHTQSYGVNIRRSIFWLIVRTSKEG